MKIGIDAGALSGVNPFKSGNYYLTLNILKRMNINNDSYNNYNDYILYTYEPIKKEIMKVLGSKFINKVAGPRRFWMMFGLPLELLKNPADLFIGFNQCLPLFTGCKSIVFVLDLAFKIYPEMFGDLNKKNIMTKLAIKNANKVIAISQSTKKDLIKYYNLPKKNIRVVFPG